MANSDEKPLESALAQTESVENNSENMAEGRAAAESVAEVSEQATKADQPPSEACANDDDETPAASPSPPHSPVMPVESGLETESVDSTERAEAASGPGVESLNGETVEANNASPVALPVESAENLDTEGTRDDADAVESVEKLSLESEPSLPLEAAEDAESPVPEPSPTATPVEPTASESEPPTRTSTDSLAEETTSSVSVSLQPLPLPLSLPSATRSTAWDKENYDHTARRFLNDTKTAPPVLETKRSSKSSSKRLDRIPVLADVTEAYYARAALNAASMASPLPDPILEPAPVQGPRRAPAGILAGNSAATNGVRRTATDPTSKSATRTSPKRTATDASIISASAPPVESKRRATIREGGSGSSSAANLRKMR